MSTLCSKFIPNETSIDEKKWNQKGTRIAEFPKKPEISYDSSVTFSMGDGKDEMKSTHQIEYIEHPVKGFQRVDNADLQTTHFQFGFDKISLSSTNADTYKSPSKQELLENKKNLKIIGKTGGNDSSVCLGNEKTVEEWKKNLKSSYKDEFTNKLSKDMKHPSIENFGKNESNVHFGYDKMDYTTTTSETYNLKPLEKSDTKCLKNTHTISSVQFGSESEKYAPLLKSTYKIDICETDKSKNLGHPKDEIEERKDLLRSSNIVFGTDDPKEYQSSMYQGAFRDVKYI